MTLLKVISGLYPLAVQGANGNTVFLGGITDSSQRGLFIFTNNSIFTVLNIL